jgi:uncharacterized LabA/DUF88 family protein
LNALSHRLISPKTEKVQSIFYFSAFAHWLPDKMARHAIYVKALQARGVTCILGHFKSKDRRCNSCGATWVAHEEKETDVSIGINLVNDAYKQRYEKAYLVTRDSDLMPAVRMIRTEFPTKQIVAIAPPWRIWVRRALSFSMAESLSCDGTITRLLPRQAGEVLQLSRLHLLQ